MFASQWEFYNWAGPGGSIIGMENNFNNKELVTTNQTASMSRPTRYTSVDQICTTNIITQHCGNKRSLFQCQQCSYAYPFPYDKDAQGACLVMLWSSLNHELFNSCVVVHPMFYLHLSMLSCGFCNNYMHLFMSFSTKHGNIQTKWNLHKDILLHV
jgi:hypothetical protein